MIEVIPVHDVPTMHVPDGAADVIEYLSRLFFGDDFILDDVLEKLLPLTELSSNVYAFLLFEVLIHLHDVGVVLSYYYGTSILSMANSFRIIFSTRLFFFLSISFIAQILPKHEHERTGEFVPHSVDLGE